LPNFPPADLEYRNKLIKAVEDEMSDREYTERRNAIIPKAERVTDEAMGAWRDNLEYRLGWGKVFLENMASLARGM
jgi:hypothetical protein